jgi:hypothetical protein
MKFTYGSGQRPLSGYTLKRGIGKGGFGEVYFALSDGGKEVAVKLLRGNQEVELRGVAQCLNLKHPNLVALYDLRTDGQGDTWVVMEYVAGEPLSVVLSRHPGGLPPELGQQWFLCLARAIAYLHDHGIVHRDLKPGNIFLENGTLKVGDYGLCKFISGSQGARQSQSVGTVHYMAPEISTGNYNKQIDVYAAGIILYEMLTGRVPFEGESAGEILMKHLTSPPNLSKLPAAYVPVVAKALSKNPALRYASMAEMARAVETIGQAHQRPVAQALPADPKPAPRPAAPAVPPEQLPSVLPAQTLRGQFADLCTSLALVPLFALLGTTLWTALAGTLWQGPRPRWDFTDPGWTDFGRFFFLTVGVCWAVLLPARLWSGRRGDVWLRRLIMLVVGAAIGAGALWLEGWFPRLPLADAAGVAVPVSPVFPSGGLADVAAYLSYFGLVFFAPRWWRMADPRRSQRFSFAPILAAGFWSLLLLLVWPQPMRGAVALVLASIILQLVSPWEPPPTPAAKRMRLRYA